jgi:gamma-glutamylputrescine oxidase
MELTMPINVHTESYYAATTNNMQAFPRLEDSLEADVCIVGGGFTGLSSALHLAQSGLKVILLEAEKVGWGASGRNGGQVGVAQRQDQYWLEDKLGKDLARQLWDLSVLSVDLVKELITKHNIDCDWTPGLLHAAYKKSHVEEYQQETEKLQSEYGFEHVRFVDENEIKSLLGTDKYYGGQLDSYSGHLHPLNFAIGLADAAHNAGAQIFEGSRVTGYQPGKEVVVTTEHGQVKAKKLILGCNGYLGKLAPKVAGKIMPINNFILATEPLSENEKEAIIRDNLCVADSKFVVNYFRFSRDNRLLFGGGETYSSQFPKDIKGFVRKHMLDIYPQLESKKIDYGWGGTLAITLNRMPHFERLNNNIYVMQGYSGHGVALATLAGKVVCDAINGNLSDFDAFATVPTHTFPGGTLLRYPGMVAGMLYYSMLDKLPG